MRFVCVILIVFVLLAWRVEAGVPVTTYPRATVTPAGPPPTFPPETPGPSYPYPAPHLMRAPASIFLPMVYRGGT